MDENGLRNWGYYEPSFKAHLGLDLMSTMQDRKPFLSGREQAIMLGQNGSMPDRKPFLSGREQAVMLGQNGIFHPRDIPISEAPMHMNYARDTWVHRDKFINMLPGNSSYGSFAESSVTHPMQMQMLPPPETNDMRMALEDPTVNKEVGSTKKRMGGAAPKAPKPKKAKKEPSVPKDNRSTQRVKAPKKNVDIVINGIDMDISAIPIPVCSCTGAPQQCYRWGCGGWQSACCTTTISMYPLPMSTKRRGARIAGRKMSQGAFKKVLERLSTEGYNFSNAIDLRTFWAKHGTNKFVTIR